MDAQPFQNTLGSIWLQNLILAAPATIGLVTFAKTSNRERQRATVDVPLDALKDPEIHKAFSTVHGLVKAGLDIPYLLSEAGLQDRRLILSVLNRYEFMASGLKTGAFDEKVYKRMYFSSVVGDWRDLYLFVHAFREQRQMPTVYQDFEALANAWALDRLRRNAEG